MKRTLFASALAVSISFLCAQSTSTQTLLNRGCATPTMPLSFEGWLNGLQSNPGKTNGGQTQSVYNIPVIVHVIHNNEAVNTVSATSGGNLNAAQIIDQINILNRDYNGQNSDTASIPNVFKPVLAHMQFNFCLAVVNPTGGILAELGIDRINRVSKGWTAPPYSTTYVTSTIKPASIWDPTRYMNIWVCGMSGGVLGFATFPNPGTSGLGGLSPPYGTSTTDGVVILNTSFGSVGTAVNSSPYHKGRTATHEVGHWVGLRHIWGDGTCATDYCNDTPPAQAANYGCPTFPHNLGVCTGNTTGEMTMNYMDYTDDLCMYMFTNDQKNRAQLIMTNSAFRLTLLTSTVCSLPTATNDIGIMYVSNPTYSQTFNCTNSISPVVVVHNYGTNTITSATYSYNIDGVNTQTVAWTGNLAPNTNATVTLPAVSSIANGSHYYNVGVYAPNGGSDTNPSNNSNNQYFIVASSFTLNVSGTPSICSGGSATLTASGGATSYTWMPGNTTGSVAVVSPTANVTYTVAASLSTCVNSKTVSVAVTPLPTLSIISSTVCSGSSGALIAQGACSYSWMPGSLSGSSITQSVSSTTAYTITGSCNGCSATGTGTITVMNQPTVSLSVAPAGSLCIGGTATITANGALSYSWSTGGSGSLLVTSPTLNTTYSVTGTNGPCSSTASVLVMVGASTLSISIAPSPATLCAGSSLTLSAIGANSYSWAGGPANTDLVISPATNTSYSVTGTNGVCSASASIVASVIPVPTVAVIASPSGTLCAGTSLTLTASGASQYSWSTSNQAASIVITPTSNAAVTVTGTSLGCSQAASYTVSIGGSTLGLHITSSADSVCVGSTVTITASGVPSYSWSNGANSPSIIVSPVTSTGYTLNVADGPCAGSTVIAIGVKLPAPIQLSVLPSTLICAGNVATLTAAGTYTAFSWSAGGSGSSVQVMPSNASSYTVNGNGAANGCTGTATIAISVAPKPLSVLTVTNTLCIADSCAGVMNAITSGGTGPYSYTLAGTSCSSVPCNSLCPGLYKLITVDSLGCTAFNFFSIECLPENTTGITEKDGSTHFRIYPSPVYGQLTIESEGPFRFTITNAIGMELQSGSADTLVSIDASGYAGGLYVIGVTSARGTSFARFVKQ